MFDKLFAKLKPAIFNYKDTLSELDTNKTFIGVMAQDIIEGLEEEGFDPSKFSIVNMEDTEFYSVDYIQLIPILISKIKQLEDRLETLEER